MGVKPINFHLRRVLSDKMPILHQENPQPHIYENMTGKEGLRGFLRNLSFCPYFETFHSFLLSKFQQYLKSKYFLIVNNKLSMRKCEKRESNFLLVDGVIDRERLFNI